MRISKDPEVRRQEIIDTACELFASRGISKTSISDIAEAVGVAKGLVYYYFSSKEDLIQSMVERLSAGVDQALQEILDRPGLDFYGRLSEIIAFYFQAIPAQKTIYALTPGDPGVFAMIRSQLSDIALKHTANLLHQGIEQERIQIAYPEHMLRIMINGLGDLYVSGITDPAVHVALIEQMLGIKKGKLTLTSQV